MGEGGSPLSHTAYVDTRPSPQLSPTYDFLMYCIHFKEGTFYGKEEKVPTCRKPTPQGGTERVTEHLLKEDEYKSD